MKLKYTLDTPQQIIITFIVLIAFLLNFFGEILNGVYRIGFTDELAILLIGFSGVLMCFSIKRIKIYHLDFIVLLIALSFVYLLFYSETLLSFVYEYYKLMIFMVFLPFLKGLTKQSFFKLAKQLNKLFLLVLSLNFIFIVMQYLTNNQILKLVGYHELRVSGWNKIGRYTGLFDVGTLGATALLIILFNEMTNKKSKTYVYIHILGVLSVISSSSKTSYLIFLAWVILYFRKYLLKHFIKIITGLAAFLLIVVNYTYKDIISKIEQYYFFLQNLDNPKVINLATVEMRAMFWGQSLKIFKDHPFGLGLGTFGDASAKYNPDAFQMSSKMWPDKYVYLSDSSLSHLLAEQGLVAFIYLLLVITPLLFTSKNFKTPAYMLMAFYFIQIPFTMGFSAGTWPLLFALIYGLIYYAKKFDDENKALAKA